MKNKLIVISFDALQINDLEKIFKLPFMAKLKNKMSVVRNLREVYPTLTYPIHVSMVTGVTPNKHGVWHNQKPSINPEEPDWNIMGSNWFWERENIKVQTLQDAVFKTGRIVATVSWPVTAGEKRGINIPEIWPSGRCSEKAESVFAAATSGSVMEKYYQKYMAYYNWKTNDDASAYVPEIAIEIIKSEKPDLMLCHVLNMDHTRHIYGETGPEVDECLRQIDILVQRFIDATKEAGTYEHTNFVFLGDHGQINIKRQMNLNVFLKQKGLITTNSEFNPEIYKAYSFSAGFSTHIILKDPENESDLKAVETVLKEAKELYPQYIERIYTKEEVNDAEGLSGEFSFVLEGTEGTLFKNELSEHEIVCLSGDGFRYQGMHGHHPDKGYKPPLAAFGPDIKEGVIINNGSMLDVCPTLAKLIGVEMNNVDGKCFDIIIQ